VIGGLYDPAAPACRADLELPSSVSLKMPTIYASLNLHFFMYDQVTMQTAMQKQGERFAI